MVDRVAYDEFGLFHENAEEFGLPYDGPPAVRRADVEVAPGRRLSALVWGEAPPELVLLHGGAQNAHTWDTVAMALGRPLVAIDLPGHGHSDAPAQGSLGVRSNAADVAAVVRGWRPRPRPSWGCRSAGSPPSRSPTSTPSSCAAWCSSTSRPGWRDRAPPHRRVRQRARTFADFDELLARTIEFNPTRSESSLRRGILHNALQRDDGSWVWRYRRFTDDGDAERGRSSRDPHRGPLGRSRADHGAAHAGPRHATGSVVDDDAEAELLRRLPAARVEHVAEAGHSVQGDDPLTLAGLLADFVPVARRRLARVGDAGERFAALPQALGVGRALRVLRAADAGRVAPLLAQAVGTPVVVGHDVGHRRGVELRERPM